MTPFSYFNVLHFILIWPKISSFCIADYNMQGRRNVFHNGRGHGRLKNNYRPQYLKIARITSIYKGEDQENVVNYRPIYILPSFSKILERIMYSRLYLYLTENNLLYSKQFGFQKRHSTDHAIVQLADQIHKMF